MRTEGRGEESGALVAANGICKSYSPGVLALEEVSLEVRAGEVHALVGENGAGKTTLAHIMAGMLSCDSGSLLLAGAPCRPLSRVHASRLGIRIVTQDLSLISSLSVAENIFLDQLPHRYGLVDFQKMNLRAAQILAQVGLKAVDPAQPVAGLGVGQQQLVEIAAALARPCRVLILDEPTAALTRTEAELLFSRIEQLKAERLGILYISHRMEEIRQIADRVTVLRDGHRVTTRAASSLSIPEILRLMVGRKLDPGVAHTSARRKEVALTVKGLNRGQRVRNVSFQVCAGEVLGLAGLMGSGRTETVRALFGADLPESGSIFLRECPRPVKIGSPRDAVRLGIALLTEDRKQQGLLLPLSVRHNISLSNLRAVVGRGPMISSEAERTAADRFVRSLSIRCASVEQPVAELSGGNQQKVALAKWLFRDCAVVIFDEPTRGIDVAAKFEIYRLIQGLARGGKAIIVVSSELNELLLLCDRIVVMSMGSPAATFDRPDFSEDRIMQAAFSGHAGIPNPVR